MKYKINCGAFVEKYTERNITVTADSEGEAERKAHDSFRQWCNKEGYNLDSAINTNRITPATGVINRKTDPQLEKSRIEAENALSAMIGGKKIHLN